MSLVWIGFEHSLQHEIEGASIDDIQVGFDFHEIDQHNGDMVVQRRFMRDMWQSDVFLIHFMSLFDASIHFGDGDMSVKR